MEVLVVIFTIFLSCSQLQFIINFSSYLIQQIYFLNQPNFIHYLYQYLFFLKYQKLQKLIHFLIIHYHLVHCPKISS